MDPAQQSPSFVVRHEFLLRRVFSLLGMIPVGAYLVIHLITNASIVSGLATFQNFVYQIHGLGIALPVVEWVFILIPLMLHAILGLVVIRGSQPNTGAYPYGSNVRYTLQRITGMIAFVFIIWHVFHMHGWFHFHWWLSTAEQLHGGMFRPYNAASSTARAINAVPFIYPMFYLVGVLATIFHFANGIWTFGITWGIWTTPGGMRRAGYACVLIGLVLTAFGVAAWAGPIMLAYDEQRLYQAQELEDMMYERNVEIGRIEANEKKRYRADERLAPPASFEGEPATARGPGEPPPR